MKKLLAILALGLALPAAPARAGQFESFGLQQAGKLLANPPQFIYEFQRNMEADTPLPPGKWLGFNYHFLGGILIIPLPDVTSAVNLSAKVRVHPEGRLMPGLPQFDLVGGFWTSALASAIEDSDAKATDAETKIKSAELGGKFFGLVATTSLEPRVRLFYGYKYSQLDLKIGLNKAQDILGSQVTSFDGGLKEHTLSAGIEHAYKPGKVWTLSMGYGLKNQLLTAKVARHGKFLTLGLNIYPESVFIMQPQVNFHLEF